MLTAVLSLTRDRLPYTQVCFNLLREKAGIDFDHFVLDQGSEDGTQEWLRDVYDPEVLICLDENIGITEGLNRLLPLTAEHDLVVKFDNDCELLTPNTVKEIGEMAVNGDMILSPHIHGLNHTPPTIQQFNNIALKTMIGGIFMAIPAVFFQHFDRKLPSGHTEKWGLDDNLICEVAHDRNMLIGYVDGYHANHFRSTEGQHEDWPDYFRRRVEEGGPP